MTRLTALVLGSALLFAPHVVWASCELHGVKAASEPAQVVAQGQESAKEIVVVVPEGAGRNETVVVGKPSQSVRLIAPSSHTGTAIGGDGQAGLPGTSAR